MKTIVQLALVVSLVFLASGSNRCADADSADADKSVTTGSDRPQGNVRMNDQTKQNVTKPRANPGISPFLDVAEANTRFGLNLLGALRAAGEGHEGNLFVSPLSVSIALAMTYNGASGETAEAMARVLGFSHLDVGALNNAMAGLTATLEHGDSLVQLTIANSLWGRQGFSFSELFLDRNREYYGAEVATLDFDSPDAPAAINRWVSDATKGMITKIVDQIPPEVVLELINAIYYKGRWQKEFDAARTRQLPFHLATGDSVNVPMMSQSGSYRYMAGEGFQAVRLPYGEGEIAMYVFLPDAPPGLDALLGSLDGDTWSKWMSAFHKRDGNVLLPRFKTKYECLLNGPLKAMGMAIAFEAGRADFSGMTSQPANLFISSVLHKAVVEVNEEGTEAAAVTEITIGVTAAIPEEKPFRFVADHPFFFVIRDDGTGTVLFLGIINSPLL
ncbi:MAG: serpin family protein [bacterium]